MTESMIEAIRVHIVGSDTPLAVTMPAEAKPGRRDNLRTFVLASTDAAVNIAPNAPKRRNTVLTVLGTAGDSVYVCGSFSDAQIYSGAIAGAGQVITLTGSSELWLIANSGNADAVTVGVFAEYDE